MNQTIIAEFLEKYDYWYALNKKSINQYIKKTTTLIDNFLKIFPKEKIKNLTLDQYVLGKNINGTVDKNTFCYWIDSALKSAGDVRGGRLTVIQRYGIAYDKKLNDYNFKLQNATKSKFGHSKKEAFKNIKLEIIKIIEATEKNDFKAIEQSCFNPLIKNKIAFLYNYNNQIPIYGDNDINLILTELKIPFCQNEKEENRIYKRNKLFEFYKSLNRPDISTLSFASFIYDNCGFRPILRNSNTSTSTNNLTQCKLVEVKSVEEIIHNTNNKKSGLVKETVETIRQKKLSGKKGEEIIKTYLLDNKDKLNINTLDFACEYNDYAHYDISYTTNQGETFYIEVKSTKLIKNLTALFEMSGPEFEFMQNHQDCYFIYFVDNVFNDEIIIKKISAAQIINYAKPTKYKFEFAIQKIEEIN